MPCLAYLKWTCIIFVCASGHAYVWCFVCWLLCPVWFFSIVFRKRSECEESFDYVGSSSSRIRSSSKRYLRQDDHSPGYHYYHCHASYRAFTVMSRYLPHVCQASQHCHEKPLTLHFPSKTLFGYVTACSALLIALLVVGAVASMWQHGYFSISQYYWCLNLMHIYTW